MEAGKMCSVGSRLYWNRPDYSWPHTMLMSVCGQRCSTLAASICSLRHFVRWRLGMQSAQLGSTGNTDEPARHLCQDRNVLLKEGRTMAFILVIDDHETSLDALATIIRSGGHEVITARNEEEA